MIMLNRADCDHQPEIEGCECALLGRDFPEPEPAHPRDTPDRSALNGAVESVLRDVLAEKYQQERIARRAAEEELESARKLIGSGPFVIVKLQSLNAITDSGEAEVRVGFGGGVTRHMLDAVLSIGRQAVKNSLPPTEPGRGQIRTTVSGEQAEHLNGMARQPVMPRTTVSAEQGDTVRLPTLSEAQEQTPRPEGEHMSPWHNLFQCGHVDCRRAAQRAQEPSTGPTLEGKGVDLACGDLTHDHLFNPPCRPPVQSFVEKHQAAQRAQEPPRVACPECGTVTGPYPEVHQCRPSGPEGCHWCMSGRSDCPRHAERSGKFPGPYPLRQSPGPY